MSLQDTLKNFKQEMRDLQARMRSEGEEGLKNALKEFFAENPEIESVSWPQYIPSFNDGDVCEFRVGEAFGKINKAFYVELGIVEASENGEEVEIEEDDYDEEGLNPTGVWSDLTKKFQFYSARTEELDNNFRQLAQVLTSHDMYPILEALFGANVKVTATKEKVTTEDYDCGW